MQFEFRPMANWPPLAWEALCAGDGVVVRHGTGVEVRDDWFCEAAWDGPFAEGGFDRTDIVAGSGGRIRGDRLTFVSSGSTVDRLQSLRTQAGWRVSNSLPCLLACDDVQLDPTYRSYYHDFVTVVSGLERVKRRVHTVTGELDLHYFENLVWDGTSLVTLEKPAGARRFSSFKSYEDFLLTAMATVAANAGDGLRAKPFKGLGTLSRGYDSTMVSVLARRAGAIGEVMTFSRARGGQSDDGSSIAAVLGLRPIVADPDAWRRQDCPEIPFIAVNGYGEEVHYAPLASLLDGRILYTGYHGDKVWAKDTKNLSPNIVRGDPTGLALSEFRLRAGFLHCPVPFWGVRQIADIVRISNDQAMEPWNIPGDYSRPISRRIVEGAGVPRAGFGQMKGAASVMLWSYKQAFLTRKAMRDYKGWLGRHRLRFQAKGLRFPLDDLLPSRVRALCLRAIDRSPQRIRRYLNARPTIARLRKSRPELFYYMFAWAAERAATAYRSSDSDVGVVRAERSR